MKSQQPRRGVEKSTTEELYKLSNELQSACDYFRGACFLAYKYIMVLWTFLWTEGSVYVWAPRMMNMTAAEQKLGGGFGSTEYAEKTPSGSLASNGTHDTNADVVTTSHPPHPPSIPLLCVKLLEANPWETLGHLRVPHLNTPFVLSYHHSNQAVVFVIEPHLFSTFIFQKHLPLLVEKKVLKYLRTDAELGDSWVFNILPARCFFSL